MRRSESGIITLRRKSDGVGSLRVTGLAGKEDLVVRAEQSYDTVRYY